MLDGFGAALDGILKFSSAIDEQLISPEDMARFGEFFASRKGFSNISNAADVAVGTSLVATNSIVTPLFVTVEHPRGLCMHGKCAKQDGGKLKVRVSDVWGVAMPNVSVMIDRVWGSSEDAPTIMAGVKMHPVADDNGLFEIHFLQRRPEQDVYRLAITVTLEAGAADNTRVVAPVTTVERSIKLTTAASITNLEVSTADNKENLSGALTHRSDYPGRIDHEVRVDGNQFLSISFRIKAPSLAFQPHQVFLRFLPDENGDGTEGQVAVTLLPKAQGKGLYQLQERLRNLSADFGNRSGRYSVTLLVGDLFLNEPIIWNFGSLRLKFR